MRRPNGVLEILSRGPHFSGKLRIDSGLNLIMLREMKTLLAILLSFIIADFPVFGRDTYTLPGGSTSLVGAYAGVLIPTADNLLVAKATDFGSNALGLFTLSIPTTGIGVGTAIIFSDGQTFSGSIQALPDPSNSTGVVGIMTATFSYTLNEVISSSTGQTLSSVSVTASAEGSFDAGQATNASSSGGQGIDLDGTSLINVSEGVVSNNGTPVIDEQITFAIEGYLQSTTPSTTSAN